MTHDKKSPNSVGVSANSNLGSAQCASTTTLLRRALNEEVISVNPLFISHLKIPNVVMIPIADSEATWDVFIAWQRGKTTGPLRTLLDALSAKPAK